MEFLGESWSERPTVNQRSCAEPASNGVGRRERIVQFALEIRQDGHVLLPPEQGIGFPHSLHQGLRRRLLPLLSLQFAEQMPHRARIAALRGVSRFHLDLPEPHFLKDSQVFRPDRVVRVLRGELGITPIRALTGPRGVQGADGSSTDPGAGLPRRRPR